MWIYELFGFIWHTILVKTNKKMFYWPNNKVCGMLSVGVFFKKNLKFILNNKKKLHPYDVR